MLLGGEDGIPAVVHRAWGSGSLVGTPPLPQGSGSGSRVGNISLVASCDHGHMISVHVKL